MGSQLFVCSILLPHVCITTWDPHHSLRSKNVGLLCSFAWYFLFGRIIVWYTLPSHWSTGSFLSYFLFSFIFPWFRWLVMLSVFLASPWWALHRPFFFFPVIREIHKFNIRIIIKVKLKEHMIFTVGIKLNTSWLWVEILCHCTKTTFSYHFIFLVFTTNI